MALSTWPEESRLAIPLRFGREGREGGLPADRQRAVLHPLDLVGELRIGRGAVGSERGLQVPAFGLLHPRVPMQCGEPSRRMPVGDMKPASSGTAGGSAWWP